MTAELSYWKKYLSKIPALRLPTDRPRPAGRNYDYAKQSFVFPAALSEQLVALSRKEGVNLFATLLAAFQTLLCRYSGQEDFAIGSPVAGRLQGNRTGSVGSSAATFVIRCNLEGDPTFREVMARVSAAAYEHRNVLFAGANEPHDSLNDSNLFQVMFALDNSPRQTWNPPRLVVGGEGIRKKLATFELSMVVTFSETGRFAGDLEYSTNLFEPHTIKRMTGHFENLLESIAANPDDHVSHVPILSEAERHQLLVAWNDTQSDYPRDKTVHELFEAHVERRPNNIAVAFEGAQISYRQLNARANQLAHYLLKLGVGLETLVGLYVERSLEMCIGLLGILKAGGAYLPLDPTYPRERLAFMLEDAQVPLILTQQHLLSELPANHGARVLCLDGNWTRGARQTANVVNKSTPSNLAYVIYTSGSTGKPKGIPISHGAVVNLLDSMRRETGIGETDCVLAVTTLSFDMAVSEILLPLSVGAAVTVVSAETAIDGDALTQRLSDGRVTFMQATPVTWRLLLEAGWVGNPGLRMISGGEALPRELATQLLGKGESLWNMYGPTETTVYSTFHKVSPGVGPVSIGRPVGNTQVYILDRRLQPQPVGVPGELYIGGSGLTQGYLNRPALTAEKFIPDIFRAEPDARLYKTGDLARYLDDGHIEYLGRIDHQIKIRGFRIELGEIEGILSQDRGVRQVVVSAREDVLGVKTLIGYVVPEPSHHPTVTGLKKFLQTKLPDYMVPSTFVFLDRLPRTPNGKVDRQALPVPPPIRLVPEEHVVAPVTDLERRLVDIWERVLHIHPVGARDNFFDLGGHSLLGLRLMREIGKSLGKEHPVACLYRAPTIEQLAKVLNEEPAAQPGSLLLPLQTEGSNPPFFWIHGEKSDAFLPRYLGPEQPIYAIMHQGHDGRPARYTTVEDIAAHYIDQIRKVQPHGPYFIGGYCFGGIVAFEMAQQLKKYAQTVELLVLLDPDNFPNYVVSQPVSATSESQPSRRESYRDKIRRHMDSLRQLSVRERAQYGFGYLKGKIRNISFVRKGIDIGKTAACKMYLSSGNLLPPSLYSHYTLAVYDRAFKNYTPRPYSGRMTIWKTAETPCDIRMWEMFALKGVESTEVPGRHTEILAEPYVKVWAEQLAEKLCSPRSLASRHSL